MRFLILFFLLASTVFAVEGQVFIVTEGGINMKLGLVTVGVYPRSTIEKYVSVEKAALLPKWRALQQTSEDHRQKSATISIQQDSLWNHAKKTGNSDEMGRAIALGHESIRELEASIRVRGEQKAIKDTLFDELPVSAALAKTKSDADGRFKLEAASSADTLLVAFATRKVGEKTEYYTWVLPPDEWESLFFLSNDNLFVLETLDPAPELFSGDRAKRQAFLANGKAGVGNTPK